MRREFMQILIVDEDNVSEDGLEFDVQREESRVTNKRLKEVTVKHIIENFHKLGKPSERNISYHSRSTGSDSDIASRRTGTFSSQYGRNTEDSNWVVGVDQIQRLVGMFGGDLDKFENFYLLRRSTSNERALDDEVTLSDFTKAVESYMNDANMDSYAMVLYLFKMKFGDEEQMVSL